MFKNYYLRALVLLSVLFMMFACERPLKCKIEQITVASATVSFSTEMTEDISGHHVGVCVSKDDPANVAITINNLGSIDGAIVRQEDAVPEKQNYSFTIYNLDPKTVYKVRAFVISIEDGSITWGDMVSFTTLEPSRPKLVSFDVASIRPRSAKIKVYWDDIEVPLTERGYVIAMSKEELDSATPVEVDAFEPEHTIKNLEPGVCYYVKAYADNVKGRTYSSVLSFTTMDMKVGRAVDLGLSVKWADINVGASNPEEPGEFFAWGETAPKEDYAENDYYYEGPIVLNRECDAATTNWGEEWRMPTMEEYEELRKKCTWKPFASAEVSGFTATGPNGNSIFFPLSGLIDGSRHVDTPEDSDWRTRDCYGYYWSSTRSRYNPNSIAFFIHTWRDANGYITSNYKNTLQQPHQGLLVRPVKVER